MLHRRALLGATALLAAPLATPALAQAPFPNRPVRLIISYPPGGVTDIVGRIVAEPLSQRLGQPVVVENRAGAGGNIGAQAASAAEPDGYTLLIGTAAMFGVNPLLYASSGVDLVRDFTLLGTINDMANVLSVNPKRLDVSSVAELVAKAKRGGLIYGSVGNGSSSHLCATLLQRLAGFEATHVPYRGSSPAVAALLAAEVDFLFDTTATSTPQIQAGTFRALGVSTPTRASALPEVPTIAEAGVKDYAVSIWNTLLVHKKTPAPVVAKLREAFTQSMDDTTKARLRNSFVDPLMVPPGELDAWLEKERSTWLRMARDARITID
ncbi:tripartite tricarboxylate transporter substrate binding protein [Siccirubricoccus sp. KC 17139]|uniref:Tripartite tricarboxylate transporter substrate binding protein n=1 Tax=Siccirubricoccus soli TaxID=2899147 RepID=A0ABT1CYG1_9PROT|nr:tripartite tricarboxylate transporter substrate binding protein [Siccirubricoccus soli]MCO6414695.1 tripartite tricarboxylate transporter substrate binding protein [Siccirubricoccus soli]MCP2680825.1 tripartite tricarboxylate transporter substrate binding protein [Siccirubricoccus soli]